MSLEKDILKKYPPKLENHLIDIESALVDKGVECENLTAIEIPDKIRLLEKETKRPEVYLCEGEVFNSIVQSKFSNCTTIVFTDIEPTSTNLTNFGVESYETTGNPTLDTVVGWNDNNTLYVSGKGNVIAFNQSCARMFYQNSKVQKIQFDAVNAEYVHSMSYFCREAYNLKSINLENFNATSVTTLSNAFLRVSSTPATDIEKLDFSSFDMSNLTGINRAFDGCFVKYIDLSHQNFNGITEQTDRVFNNTICIFLDLSHCSFDNLVEFNTLFHSSKTSLQSGFYGTVDLSHTTFEKCNNLGSMFNGDDFYFINVSGWDISHVTNFNSMFCGTPLNGICGDDWTKQKSNLSSYTVFTNCTSLKNWDNNNRSGLFCKPEEDGGYFIRDGAYLCNGADFLQRIESLVEYPTNLFTVDTKPPSGVPTVSLGSVNYRKTTPMYFGGRNPYMGNVVAWNEGNDIYISAMGKKIILHENSWGLFSNFWHGDTLDVEDLDTHYVKDMSAMFSGTFGDYQLDLSKWDTSNVTNMVSMFSMAKTSSLDLSSWNTSNVTDMQSMFMESTIRSINLSNLDVSSVENMSGMFNCAYGLEELDLSGWKTNSLIYMAAMFNACDKLKVLNVNHFNIKNVKSFSETFRACEKLTELDLSSWDTSNATDMQGMFDRCSDLQTLKLNNFSVKNLDTTTKNKGVYDMFKDCSNLKTIYAKNWYSEKTGITNSTNTFSNCTSLPGYSSSKTNGSYCKPTSSGGYFTTP